MVLKFETNLGVIGSLATENGLHVVGFYTYLVELKLNFIANAVLSASVFYTYLVELKPISKGVAPSKTARCFIPT